VPVGAREQQTAGIEFGRIVRIHVQHRHRHAAARRRRDEAVDLDRRIEPQQSEIGPQRIVKRSSVA